MFQYSFVFFSVGNKIRHVQLFCFAALGPILPFLNVFGKQLGVSEVVMGSITAILPILFLVAKPLFGLIVDYFQEQRKTVFMCLLCTMSICYVLLYFIPQPDRPFITDKSTYHLSGIQCDQLDTCQSWVSNLQHFSLQLQTDNRGVCITVMAALYYAFFIQSA
jgi:MFS family permease